MFMHADFFQIPQRAIFAYEKWTGLNVVVHDVDGAQLQPYLSPEHFLHRQPLCAAVKNSGFLHKCHEFETDRLRAEIVNFPEGRVHVCHAGLVEWVTPVLLEGKVTLILFAGQRTRGKAIPNVYFDNSPPTRLNGWGTTIALPKSVDGAESDLILEGLRQLGARLKLWLIEARSFDRSSQNRADLAQTNRRAFILQYIRRHSHRTITLADLADELHLSESRTAHVVKEECGQSFGALLNEARVRAAAVLLQHSDRTVSEVAAQCGFSNMTFFYRLFKERTGMTPAAYRSQVRGG